MKINRLVLGTAQLGMDYGIANVTGQPDGNRVAKIIETAWEGGVRELDTAPGYGLSEKNIGQSLQVLGLNDKMKVASKLPLDFSQYQLSQVVDIVSLSLEQLSIPKLTVLYLHQEKMLDWWNKGLGEKLGVCISQGLVEKIGVSVYSPQYATQALQCPGLQVVQLPANIFDQRFIDAGFYTQAQKKNMKIYLRSVFLQGLFFLKPRQLQERMQFCRESIQFLYDFSLEQHISIHTLALGYIKLLFPHAQVIIGAETVKQVKENICTWNTPLEADIINEFIRQFPGVNEQVVNPQLWFSRVS